MQDSAPNKHQLKTLQTQNKLLEAAELVFVREGYESAQLATIAAVAGRTKGAVYAHYKSKEELFLALFESRMHQYTEQFRQKQQSCATRKERQQAFRSFFLEKLKDQSWFTLTLEYKLFALRHPESIGKLRKSFQQARPSECDPIFDGLFGPLSAQRRKLTNAGLAAIISILSALIIESHFDPENLDPESTREILNRTFQILFPMFE